MELDRVSDGLGAIVKADGNDAIRIDIDPLADRESTSQPSFKISAERTIPFRDREKYCFVRVGVNEPENTSVLSATVYCLIVRDPRLDMRNDRRGKPHENSVELLITNRVNWPNAECRQNRA